jgi:hypothetical protein
MAPAHVRTYLSRQGMTISRPRYSRLFMDSWFATAIPASIGLVIVGLGLFMAYA